MLLLNIVDKAEVYEVGIFGEACMGKWK